MMSSARARAVEILASLWAIWNAASITRKHRRAGHFALFFVPVGLAVAGVNYAVLRDAPLLACLSPDSWGYVSLNFLRTQGYQLFLSAIVLLLGDLRWVGPVQLNAMLLSYVAIAFAVRLLFRSNVAGFIAAAVLMLNAQLYEWYPQVMTEALFIALIGLHLVCVILVLDRYSDRWALAVGVTVAVMIMVRPNGVSFLLGVPVLAVLLPRYWRRIAVFGITPVLLAVLVQATFNYYQQGFFGLTLFQGPQLVATYGELITSRMPTDYPELATALETRLRPLYAQYPKPEERSFPFEYAEISAEVVSSAQYEYSWPEVSSYVDSLMPGANVTSKASAIDKIGTSLAISAVAHNPVGFAREVSSGYAMYWAKNSLQITPGLNSLYARCYLDSTTRISGWPGPFTQVMDFAPYWQEETRSSITAAESAGLRLIDRPWRWLAQNLPARYLLRVVAFFVSTSAILALLVRHQVGPLIGLWAYLGVILHGGFLVLSVANASFRRYAAPFDVVIMLVLVTFLLAMWDVLAARLRGPLMASSGFLETASTNGRAT